MIKIINLKDSIYPDIAFYNLSCEIESARHGDVNVIIAIHGYGSHGQGGEIKKEIHKNLRLIKNKNRDIVYIKGEEWSENHQYYEKMIEIEPELILNSQITGLNSGVTIVWIKK